MGGRENLGKRLANARNVTVGGDTTNGRSRLCSHFTGFLIIFVHGTIA